MTTVEETSTTMDLTSWRSRDVMNVSITTTEEMWLLIDTTNGSEPLDGAAFRPVRPQAPPYRPGGPPDPTEVLLHSLTQQLNRYGTPAYCGVGIVGNLAAILLLTHSDTWRLSAAHYLLAVLASDTAYLVNLLISWLNQLGVAVYEHGGLCHFTTFLSHGSCFLALWCLVCFTVDGFIRIACHPERRQRLCTTTRANMVVLAMVAVATAVFINISITFGVPAGPVLRCEPLPMFIVTLQTLFKIDVYLNTMLPDLLILYLVLHALVAALACRSAANGGGRGPCDCGCCVDDPEAAVVGAVQVARHADERCLESDFRRLYLVYVLLSLSLNVASHLPKMYYTIHGLFHPRQPLTMKAFAWQPLLIHAYYLRCSLNLFVCLCVSKDFRSVVGAPMTSTCTCLQRCGRRRGNHSAHLEDGVPSGSREEDETGTALMKHTTSHSTTPV